MSLCNLYCIRLGCVLRVNASCHVPRWHCTHPFEIPDILPRAHQEILTDPGLHSLHMYVTWEVTCLAGTACRARHRNFIDM